MVVVEIKVSVSIVKTAKTLIALLIPIKPMRASVEGGTATKTGTTKGNRNVVGKTIIEMEICKLKMINSLQIVITNNKEEEVVMDEVAMDEGVMNEVMAEVIREVIIMMGMMVDMMVSSSISKIKTIKVEVEVAEVVAIISKIAIVMVVEEIVVIINKKASQDFRSKELAVELLST